MQRREGDPARAQVISSRAPSYATLPTARLLPGPQADNDPPAASFFVHDRARHRRYGRAMSRFAIAVAAAGLVLAGPLAAQPPAAMASTARAGLPPLDTEQSAQLTCAAVFAIVASEQARGSATASQWPQLKVRGREYFVRFGARTMDATHASRDQVRALLESEVARLQVLAQERGNPDAVLAAQKPGCLERLDRETAKLAQPTLAQCTAIMALAYEEVYARDGLTTARARDLKTLATVLEARERKAMQAQGVPLATIDQAVAQAHDAMLKEALTAGPGVEGYDLQTCYDLAAPEPDKHY